jgi:hypothetical protein
VAELPLLTAGAMKTVESFGWYFVMYDYRLARIFFGVFHYRYSNIFLQLAEAPYRSRAMHIRKII